VANTLGLFRNGAVGFIDWLDALLEHEPIRYGGILFWIALNIAARFVVAALDEIGARFSCATISIPICVGVGKDALADNENVTTEYCPRSAGQSGHNLHSLRLGPSDVPDAKMIQWNRSRLQRVRDRQVRGKHLTRTR
jgi:hypothetical protein